jgi:two-component system, cell cycle response regulator DivK
MKKVLYVEDDAVNALVIQKFLEKEFEVVHVFDGEACTEYLKKNSVDLILMDINLGRGKMDGVETLKNIREFPAVARLPVVAVTAYAMPEDEQRFLSEGFNRYMAKPVERPAILKLIHDLLSNIQ